MRDVKLELAQARVTEALSALESIFVPEMKLTFFARHPDNPHAHLLVSADDLPEIRRGLDQLEADLEVPRG